MQQEQPKQESEPRSDDALHMHWWENPNVLDYFGIMLIATPYIVRFIGGLLQNFMGGVVVGLVVSAMVAGCSSMARRTKKWGAVDVVLVGFAVLLLWQLRDQNFVTSNQYWLLVAVTTGNLLRFYAWRLRKRTSRSAPGQGHL